MGGGVVGAIDEFLEDLYSGTQRMSRDEIHRRAVASGLPVEVVGALDALPEGLYAQDEVVAAIAQVGSGEAATGVPADTLTDDELDRDLATLHRTRHDTFRHAPPQALQRHTERMLELDAEYLRRQPLRDVSPARLRSRDVSPARPRSGAPEASPPR